MAELPTGTVTMLFSDIAGSTRLLGRLGAQYADVLTAQRFILRSAWQVWDGVEMGTEGDSFFVVFSVASDAINAALQAQRELLQIEWPAGEPVTVRMGVHTGEPTRHEDGYIGMDVHRAARVAAIANGGQIVLTDTTAGLVRTHLPENAQLEDLGRHRLKDLSTPEHLFQVTVDGMQRDLPPVRSLGTVSSLPKPRTRLIGRDQDVDDLIRMFTDSGVRLVTLTGPGGTGKTRLSISVAAKLASSLPDGVYFVPLASATTSDAMWTTLGDLLGVGEDRSPSQVLGALEHLRCLVVLDNLEQLHSAGGVVEELLVGAPQLAIVATSRGPLHVAGEHTFEVAPLMLPRDHTVEAARDATAVQLFCNHAKMARADFELTDENASDIATICRRLDGLPLAIELAAARSRLLSPAALLHRLSSSWETTSKDVDRPQRQRSLRDTIAWSHNLLEPRLQIFFRRLGAFPGPADLDAIEAVTETAGDVLDDISALTDVALVRIIDTPAGEPRFTLLQTVRDFALDVMRRAGDLEDTQRRHAEHYVALAERTAPLLATAQQLEAADRLELEHTNFQTALSWSLRPEMSTAPPPDAADLGIRLCAALWWFWASQGHVAAGQRWFARAAEVAGDRDSSAVARIWLGLGIWTTWDSDAGQYSANQLLEQSLEMARRWGDARTMSEAALTLAQWHEEVERYDQARDFYERGLAWANEAGDDVCRASALHHYAWLVFESGDHDRAVAMVTQAQDISARLGDERDVLTRRRQLVDMTLQSGDAERARDMLLELVPDVLRVRQPALSIMVVGTFADIFLALGETPLGVELLTARNRHHFSIGWPEAVVRQFDGVLAEARAAIGDAAFEAAAARGAALDLPDALTLAARSARTHAGEFDPRGEA